MIRRAFSGQALALCFFVNVMLCHDVAHAEPPLIPHPPHPPTEFIHSMDAITALERFSGTWEGIETEHSIWGEKTTRVIRCVGRPANSDILMLALWVGRKSYDLDIITYDPAELSYKIDLVGFRLFTGSNATSVERALRVGDRTTLSWTEPAFDGGSRTYAIFIDNGVWRESTEEVDTTGKKIGHGEASLTRTGPADWSILN
jgi:hypothetical protein